MVEQLCTLDVRVPWSPEALAQTPTQLHQVLHKLKEGQRNPQKVHIEASAKHVAES